MQKEEIEILLASVPFERMDPQTRALVERHLQNDPELRDAAEFDAFMENSLRPLQMTRKLKHTSSAAVRAASGSAPSSRRLPSSRLQISRRHLKRTSDASLHWLAAASLALTALGIAFWLFARTPDPQITHQYQSPTLEQLKPSAARETTARREAPTVIEPQTQNSPQHSSSLKSVVKALPVTPTLHENHLAAQTTGNAATDDEDLYGWLEPERTILLQKRAQEALAQEAWPLMPIDEDETQPAKQQAQARMSGSDRGQATLRPAASTWSGADTIRLSDGKMGLALADADLRIVTEGSPHAQAKRDLIAVAHGPNDASRLIGLGTNDLVPASPEKGDSAIPVEGSAFLLWLERPERKACYRIKVLAYQAGVKCEIRWERISTQLALTELEQAQQRVFMNAHQGTDKGTAPKSKSSKTIQAPSFGE